MLDKRYVAGKWIYRAPGALVWTYSRADAIESRQNNGRGMPVEVSQTTDAGRDDYGKF
jgi:hypothetical protein